MNIQQPAAYLDHMLKQTREHHVALSSMADLKANILMTLSSVVLTLSVRHVGDPRTRAAALILIFFCLVTMVCAVYTVMPKVSVLLRRRQPDVNDPSFNLLFFSDYLQLDYGAYVKAMEEVMNDPSRSYEMQLRELYTLGRFLAKKNYRFVRLAYLAFLTGVFASGALMLVSGLL